MDSAATLVERPSRRPDGLVLVTGLVCALGYLITSPIGDLGPLQDFYRPHQVFVKVVQWTGFAIGAWGVHRAAARRPTRIALLLLIAAACQLPGVLAPPQSSGDAYRYVWDGRVQLSGTSPYRYAPLDDHLARLRDPVLFPGLPPNRLSGVLTSPGAPTDPAQIAALKQAAPLTRINRPGVPTIYPPVAQLWFTAIATVTPWSAGTLGLQLGAALLALLLTGVIGTVLRRRGRDPAAAVFWAWSPVGVLETGNGAHVDGLAAVLIVAALLVLDRPDSRARRVGGFLLGLAVATKILPLLLIPAVTVLRRRSGGGIRGLQVPFTAVGTALAGYLPHVLVAGSLVLGYLPGYLNEEGFEDGRKRYAVLALVLPSGLRRPVAVLLLLALALVVLWRATPARPELGALWMYGGSLLISTPEYPWYCLPLLALTALTRRPEWLALGIATQFAYIHGHADRPVAVVGFGYLVAAAVIGISSMLRARSAPADRLVELRPVRRPESPAPVGTP